MKGKFVDKGTSIEYEHGVTLGCNRAVESFEDCSMPVVGEKYRFFDDGKTGYSRRFIAECVKIIPYSEASAELIDAWQNNVEDCPWLFHKHTDYFVVCSIPSYDKNPVYCVRQRNGGWFSIDYPNWWMGGELDVKGDYFTKAGWDESDWCCEDDGTKPKED